MTTLLYQGHGSLRLSTNAGHVVYVDPFMSPAGVDSDEAYELPADVVLVTHQHHDHNAVDKMPHAAGCVVWQNMDAHPRRDAYLRREFLGGEVSVEAVEAYNRNHPKDECVGYVVRVDGLTLYFAGDTSTTSQMGLMPSMDIDYAFLPGDGIYNMDVAEAADCASLIKARHNVPIHLHPMQPYGEEEAARFAQLAPDVLLIRPGAPVELSKE